MSSDKVKLRQCIAKYNKVIAVCPDVGMPVAEEEILAGSFPWSALIGKGKI